MRAPGTGLSKTAAMLDERELLQALTKQINASELRVIGDAA